MAQLVLGGIGAAVGGYFGGAAGAETGFAIGVSIGGLLFPPKLKPQQASRVKDLRVMGSGYGSVIPQIFGSMRMHGNMIWSTDLVEHKGPRQSAGKGVRRSGQTKTYYTVSCAVAVCRGPIGRIKRIWAEDRVIYDDSLSPVSNYTIRTYTGTEVQNVDTLIASSEADTPAYRGLAYVVFENLDLSSWGNRIPSFSFEVGELGGGTTTIGNIFDTLFPQVGLTSAQYSITEGTDIVKGFHIIERGTLVNAVEELLICYKYDIIDVDGKVTLKKRGSSASVTIPARDLGSHVWQGEGSSPEQKVVTKRKQDMELPFRIDLVYFSPTSDYQTGSQGAERFTKINLQDATTVQAPLTLTDNTARQMAEYILYQQWVEREEFIVAVSLRYLYLCPGDVINITVGESENILRVRIVSMDIGLFGPIQLNCVLDDAAILTQTLSGASVQTAVDIYEDIDTAITVWSGNALRDLDAAASGIYVALGAAGDWPGAQLYVSKDSGSSYQLLDTVYDSASYGTALTALPAYTTTGGWDVTNHVDINLVGGSAPVSTSDDDVLAGSNSFIIGDEVIQAATVTPLGGSQYRLSRLLRGRRGTDGHWASHIIGERFVALNFGDVRRYEFNDNMRGKTVLLKAVSTTQTLAGVSPTSIVISGDEFKCYAPVTITGARDGPLNLTISWLRRGRYNNALQDSHEIPLGETSEAYEVDIYNGLSVVRTLSSAVDSVVYSAAQQVTDFGSTQPSVVIKVYQIGKYGRGFPGSATV